MTRTAALLVGLILLSAAACTPGPYVRSAHLTVSPPAAGATMAPGELSVAVIVPEPTVALQKITTTPLSPCGPVDILPVPLGSHFRQTVEDRVGRAFRLVADPGLAGAILEANLSEVALETGCGFNFHYFATASGSLRALAPDGAELWRAPLTAKRVEVRHRDDAESVEAFWGRVIGSGVSALVDDWILDLRLRPAASFAFAPTMTAPGPPATAKPAAALPPPPPAPPPRLAARPAVLHFPKGPERPDDIAVIIGNADYTRQGKDIPDIRPAHADAEGVRLYVQQTLGVKSGNLILLKDATGAQLARVLGSAENPRGQLFDWVKPGKSRVFVYYSGHGAPGIKGAGPYLVPSDADAARIELSGYPLKQLYDNLSKLPAQSVTVVLEACFSGLSPAGSVVANASPVYLEVTAPQVPRNLTVISAGAANQVASWEPDGSASLFTRHFLEGMAGRADFDKDGKVSLDELDRHLKDTLTYQARRHYGRDQNAQIVTGGVR